MRYILLTRKNGADALWEWGDELRPLSDLGVGLAGHYFVPNSQRLVIWYTDGRAYVLDLNWLHAMGSDPATRSITELEQLFCSRPYVSARFEKETLGPYLLGNSPQVCR